MHGQLKGEASYILPSLSLLKSVASSGADHDKETESTAQAIENAFEAFKVRVDVVATNRGPTVTQYELDLLDPSMRVGKLPAYERDLCLRLGVSGVRIVAPLPNKSTVGVDVPNKIKDPVTMKDLAEGFNTSGMALPLILGKDSIGKPLVADLARMPHLLIAGATGTGKSVCLNSIVTSLLLFKTPSELQLVMVDPKFVELAGYAGIPFMMAPPVTDMKRADHVLRWACKTMDNRYETLRRAQARDITAYNARASKAMPFIVVIIDEFAELMAVCEEAEGYIVRLAAKSRACGIHLILTTQRPSADVVTGLIKANLPARICFRVVDKVNARIVMDQNGAENLLGLGDMLFLAPGTSQPLRAQGVYVSDAEIQAIVDHAKSQGKPSYDESLMEDGEPETENNDGELDGVEWRYNRLFHDAVRVVFKYGRAYPAILTRHCGFQRSMAEEYLAEMERIAILSPEKMGERTLRKSWREWLVMLAESGFTWLETDPTYKN